MTNVMRKAYAEIDEILKYLPSSYSAKIPAEFKKVFKEQKLSNYKVDVDSAKPLSEQSFLRETIIILSILRYNFWCKSEEEKKVIQEKLKENGKIHKEMFDISKLNEKRVEASVYDADVQSAKNLPVKVEKKSWFFSFILKIKSLFNK